MDLLEKPLASLFQDAKPERMQDIFTQLAAIGVVRIAAAALVIILVSHLWVSPLMFGRSFIRLSGIRPGDIRPQQKRLHFIVGLITSVVTACLLGLFADHAQYRLPMLLSGVGFIWLFVMLEQMNGFVWRREPFALFLLQTFRSLAALLAGAAVFYFWS